MNRCVAWLLLLTHIVLLILASFGIVFAAANFFSWDLPPHPSSPDTFHDDQSTTEASDDYIKYVRSTEKYASYLHDPKLYLVIPCGTTLMVAGILLMAGTCSRKIFATTVGLYSSLGLWILTLVTAIMYQSVPWDSTQYFNDSFPMVLGIQIPMIFLLFLQVILAMWELRRQQANWPVINFTNIFTLGTILSVTQMTLAVYTALSLYHSPLQWGLRSMSPKHTFSNFWDYPTVKYPEYYFLPCVVACAYGLTISFEGIASHFFGLVYNRLMVCTALISAVFYGVVGVLASPIFVSATVGLYLMYPRVMIFASVMSTLNFIQAFTCMIYPSAMRTTPKYLWVIANRLSSTDFFPRSYGSNEITGDSFASSFGALSKGIVALRKNFPGSNFLLINILSMLVSLLALILVSIGVYYPWGRSWPGTVMLCGDVAVICRTLPAIVTELVNRKLVPPPLLQITIHCLLENCLLFIGAIGAFCNGRSCMCIAGAAVNMVYFIFQSTLVAGNCCLLQKAATVKGEVTQGPEDTQPFAKEEPEDAQVLSDETQNGDIHSLA